jgi:protoporphyrinogen oxidase
MKMDKSEMLNKACEIQYKLGYAKAISEFKEKLKEDYRIKLIHTGFTTEVGGNAKIRAIAFEQFEEIIEKTAQEIS